MNSREILFGMGVKNVQSVSPKKESGKIFT